MPEHYSRFDYKVIYARASAQDPTLGSAYEADDGVPLTADLYGRLYTVPNAGAGASTPVDHSGTIAQGGASQPAIAANAARKGYLIHNPALAGEVLSVAFGAGGWIDLQPGGTLDSNGLFFSGDINVKAVTAPHAYTAYEGV